MTTNPERTAARKEYRKLLARYVALCKSIRKQGGAEKADRALLEERAAVTTRMGYISTQIL